jgi:hypothetical protein
MTSVGDGKYALGPVRVKMEDDGTWTAFAEGEALPGRHESKEARGGGYGSGWIRDDRAELRPRISTFSRVPDAVSVAVLWRQLLLGFRHVQLLEFLAYGFNDRFRNFLGKRLGVRLLKHDLFAAFIHRTVGGNLPTALSS